MIVEPGHHHQGHHHHRGLSGCEGKEQASETTFALHPDTVSDVTMWPQGSEPPSYNEHISWNALSSCRIDYFNNKFGRSEFSSTGMARKGNVKAPTPVKAYVGGGELWKSEDFSTNVATTVNAIDETDSKCIAGHLRGSIHTYN